MIGTCEVWAVSGISVCRAGYWAILFAGNFVLRKGI